MALWQYQQRAAPPPGAPDSPPAAALDWWQPASLPVQHFIPRPRQPGYSVTAVMELTLVTVPDPPLTWFQPASVPTRRPLPRQQGTWQGFTEPTLFVPPDPPLTWLPCVEPLPIRVRPRPYAGLTSPPLPYVPPPNFWTPKEAERHFPARPRQQGWWCGILEDFVVLNPPNPWAYMQPQIPVKRREQRPFGGTVEPLGSIPPAASWFRPASEPVRPPKPRQQGWWAGLLEQNVVGPIVPHDQQPMPVRRKPAVQGGMTAPLMPTDVAAELDWLPAYPDVAQQKRNKSATSQYVQPLFHGDIATDMDWLPIAGQPLRVVPRPHSGESKPTFTPLPVVPLTQEQRPLPRSYPTWVCPSGTSTVEPTLVLTPPVLAWSPSCVNVPRGAYPRPHGSTILPLTTTVADAVEQPTIWRVPARSHTWVVADRSKEWDVQRREVT